MPVLTICLLVFIFSWGCDSSADKSKVSSKLKISLKQKEIKVVLPKKTNFVQKSSGLFQIETNDLNIQTVKQKVGNFEDRLGFLKKTEDGSMPDEEEIIKFLKSVKDFDWLLKKVRDLTRDYKRGDTINLGKIVFLCTNAVKYIKNPENVNCFLYEAARATKKMLKRDHLAIELYSKVIERIDKGLATAKARESASSIAYLYKKHKKYKSAEAMFNKYAEYCENIDHNKKNVVSAKTIIAFMLIETEPERSEQIAVKLLDDYEIAKKNKSLLYILEFHELRKKYPDETVGQIYGRINKNKPKKPKAKNQ